MSVDEIILWLMAIFMALGALDRIFGSRLGLGKQFEEGILAIGALALSMLGILSLAPVLARLLRPVLVPVYGFLGADPAMFAGTILANDMGGAPLASIEMGKGDRDRAERILGSSAALLVCVSAVLTVCLLYTSPSPRDETSSRMPSSA